ncbi:MAG TPA: phytoene/squalene synthase family protein [Sphingomonadales bacterium]
MVEIAREIHDRLAAELKAQDRDRYMTGLFAPPAARDRLFALYAFNLELARIADLVSEPMIGEIRLQWWREAVEGVMAGTPRRHDVTEALAAAMDAARLQESDLVALIDARSADLDEAPFETLDDLLAYLDGTAGTLMRLACDLLGAPAAPELSRAGGRAYGLTGVLRAIGYHAAEGRVLLPKAMLRAEDIDPHDLIQRRATPGLHRVVAALAQSAEGALADLLARRRDIPRAAVPAFLPAVLARADLKLLRRVGFDPFAPALAAPRPGRIARLIWHGMRQRL